LGLFWYLPPFCWQTRRVDRYFRMAKRIIVIISFVVGMAVGASGQISRGYDRPRDYDQQSVFILAGYAQGPHFTKFVDWANAHYADEFGSDWQDERFGGGLNFAVGLRQRLSRNFGVEFDFAFHSSTIKKQFDGFDEGVPFFSNAHLDWT